MAPDCSALGDGDPSYADLGLAAGNGFLRYVLGTLLIGIWVVGAVMAAVLLQQELLLPSSALLPGGMGRILFQDICRLAPLLLAIGSVLVLLRLILPHLHDRPWRDLIGPQHRLSFGVLLRSSLLWLAILAVPSLAALFMGDETLRMQAVEPVRFLLFVLFLMPAILIQVAAEEALFRGYLFQGFQVAFRSMFMAAVPVAALFALAHAGSHTVHGWLAYALYAALSLFLSAVTIRSNRLEPAIGIHFAQNLTAIFLFGSFDPDLPALAAAADLSMTWLDLLGFGLAALVYYQIAFRWGWVTQPRGKKPVPL